MSYRSYTTTDFCEAVKNSKSIAETLRKLELRPCGGNYNTVHRKVAELGLDTSHFTGQLWSKGLQLKDFESFNKVSSIKPHLIKQRGRKCEKCQLSQWQETDIPLEVHHINGKRNENQEANLQLLCPNCHALTPTFRRRRGDVA